MSKRENLIVTVEEIKLQEMYIEKVAEKVRTKFVTGKPMVNITTWGCQMNEHDSECLRKWDMVLLKNRAMLT